MTALALLMIGGGVFSAYAGITGQPVVPALRSVLSGRKPDPLPQRLATEAQRDDNAASRGPQLGTGSGTGLEDELARRLRALMAAAPGPVSIVSGYRSPERQAQLYADAVKKYGSEAAARKWVAPPGKSNHGKGRPDAPMAYDLGFAGGMNGSVKAWVHANAARFGLRFPMAHEPWHVEIATTAPIGRSQPVVRDSRHLEHA